MNLAFYSSLILFSLLITVWQHPDFAVGVVDRIEGEKAIVLLEDREEEVVLNLAQLKILVDKDSWLLLNLQGEWPKVVQALPAFENINKNRSAQLMDALRDKGRSLQNRTDRTGISSFMDEYRPVWQ